MFRMLSLPVEPDLYRLLTVYPNESEAVSRVKSLSHLVERLPCPNQFRCVLVVGGLGQELRKIAVELLAEFPGAFSSMCCPMLVGLCQQLALLLIGKIGLEKISQREVRFP